MNNQQRPEVSKQQLKKMAVAARHHTNAEEELKAVHQQTRIRKVIAALKRARTTRRLTIDHVAEASGVHKSVISRFENESADPHLGTLLRYADAIGADLAVLVDGERASDFGIDTSLVHPEDDGIPARLKFSVKGDGRDTEDTDFMTWLTYDNMPRIFARVEKLLNSGRRFTVVTHLVADPKDHQFGRGSIAPDTQVYPSLTVDRDAWDLGPRVITNYSNSERHFRIYFERQSIPRPLPEIVIAADDIDEATASERWANKLPSTRVEVVGTGQELDSYIEFVEWGDDTIGEVTRLQLEHP